MRVALIDFSNFLYKYKNTITTKITVNGVVTNTSTLVGIERTLKYMTQFDWVILAIDGYPNLFKQIYPLYKATRDREEQQENSVKTSFVLAHALAVAEDYDINLTIAAALNEEADQVISSIINRSKGKIPALFQRSTSGELKDDLFLKKYNNEFELQGELDNFPPDTEFVIGTTDADMYQLTEIPGVFISNDIMCRNLAEQTPKSVKNLAPETIPVYKAFFGDTSDNIPQSFDSKVIPPSEVIKLLKSDLSNSDDLREFVQAVKVGSPRNLVPKSAKLLSALDVKQFLINYEITNLRYFSNPRVFGLKSEDTVDFVKKTYLSKRIKR